VGVLPVLVLAAGFGTRLDPLTRLVAKPAVPAGGRTLLERVLEWLAHESVRDVVINLHYRPETITRVVGDGVHLGLSVRYSWERQLLGSAGGPRHALGLIDSDTFVIVNGDTLCSLALSELIAAHRRTGAAVTAAVIPNPAAGRYNGIVADADGRVRGFVLRGQAHDSWHFVGIQVVDAKVFASLSDDAPAETVSGIYRDLLDDPRGIWIWRADAPFVDIGTPRDYLDAVRRWSPHEGLVLEGEDVVIDPSARVTRSVAWSGARVAPGAELDECVLAGGVHVPAGFREHGAVLMPASVLRETDRVRTARGVAVFPLEDPSR
jgi:NDP-sugar pyrophosphorylase family protein